MGRFLDRVVVLIHFLFSLSSLLLIVLVALFIASEGLRALKFIPLGNFFLQPFWQAHASSQKYSLIPLILGTLMTSLPALVLSGLVGLGIGIYIAEFASPRLRGLIKVIIEILAGIPSVVIGFFVLTTVTDFIFELTQYQFDRLNALVASIGVALVIIPIISTITDDALRAVPSDYRDAAHSLAASKWDTTLRVVLPAAASGVVSAMLLGFGRAIGETMIVLMAVGNAKVITINPLRSVSPISATIASEMGDVVIGSEHYFALFMAGTVLFIITFLVNLLAFRYTEKFSLRSS